MITVTAVGSKGFCLYWAHLACHYKHSLIIMSDELDARRAREFGIRNAYIIPAIPRPYETGGYWWIKDAERLPMRDYIVGPLDYDALFYDNHGETVVVDTHTQVQLSVAGVMLQSTIILFEDEKLAGYPVMTAPYQPIKCEMSDLTRDINDYRNSINYVSVIGAGERVYHCHRTQFIGSYMTVESLPSLLKWFT